MDTKHFKTKGLRTMGEGCLWHLLQSPHPISTSSLLPKKMENKEWIKRLNK